MACGQGDKGRILDDLVVFSSAGFGGTDHRYVREHFRRLGQLVHCLSASLRNGFHNKMSFSVLVFQSEISDKLRFTTFYFYFSLIVAELILSCFNEKPPLFSNIDTDPVSQPDTQTHRPCESTRHTDRQWPLLTLSPQNPCPQSTAGFLSTMTFWWFTR